MPTRGKAIYTQPLIATSGTHIRAILTHWTPTGSIWLAGFPRASALRLRRAVGTPVPACFTHGYTTIAP
eukprot:3823736-Pyramimonas_sp.AAC.1